MADYNPELVTVVTDILKDILDPDGTIEYYTDYHDVGSLDSAEDIKAIAEHLKNTNGDVELALIQTFYDTQDSWIFDAETYEENELYKEVKKELESYDDEHGTELADELDYIGWDYDFFEQCGYHGVKFDIPAYYPSEICLELELATYEEANHEGYIIDFFGGYYPHSSNIDDPEMRDNMLVKLLESQGLSPEDIYDESKSDKVLDSVRRELNNMSSNIDFLTVLGAFDLEDAAKLLSGDFSSITINPGATIGIFDRWNGGGSLFEIQLDSAWTVSSDNVERIYLSTGSGGGYSVPEVYGISPNEPSFYNSNVTVN